MPTKDVSNSDRAIADFSMEIGLDAEIPTYSGGLGVLAADLKIPAATYRSPG